MIKACDKIKFTLNGSELREVTISNYHPDIGITIKDERGELVCISFEQHAKTMQEHPDAKSLFNGHIYTHLAWVANEIETTGVLDWSKFLKNFKNFKDFKNFDANHASAMSECAFKE